MSSTFTQRDGLPFLDFGHVPELLPKNGDVLVMFDTLDQYSAYVLPQML